MCGPRVKLSQSVVFGPSGACLRPYGCGGGARGAWDPPRASIVLGRRGLEPRAPATLNGPGSFGETDGISSSGISSSSSSSPSGPDRGLVVASGSYRDFASSFCLSSLRGIALPPRAVTS